MRAQISMPFPVSVYLGLPNIMPELENENKFSTHCTTI